MDNLNDLIEKYKKEMISLARKSGYSPSQSFLPEITNESQTQSIHSDKNIAAENETQGHFGSLKVSVYSGNEAFPIETARVEVFDKNGNELYSILTNSGGIAEGMILSAPSASRNDEPDTDGAFSVYVVRVSHPDYVSEEFDDVQIFEGVESIQQVFLRPMNNMEIQSRGEYDG